jgi:hypothetical protein
VGPTTGLFGFPAQINTVSAEKLNACTAALDISNIRPLKFKELEEQFNLSHGTIWNIVHELLGYRNVCTRWVSRQLTEDHKKNRVGTSLAHLHCFNNHGEDFLEQIITGDEAWVHQYCPETKAQSMVWKHPGFPTIKYFKTSTNSGKMMATVLVCFCCILLLMKQPILLPIRPFSKT